MPADHDQNDGTVLRQPAAPISPQEVSGIREAVAVMRHLFATLGPSREVWVDRDLAPRFKLICDIGEQSKVLLRGAPRLLDAIEALTAKNQRLTDALNQTVQEATAAIDDRLKPEIERLAAENARLKAEADQDEAETNKLIEMAWVDAGALKPVAWKDRAQAAEAEVERLKGAIWHAVQFSRRLPHDYDHKQDFTGETVPIRREALGRLYEAVGHRTDAPGQVSRELAEAFDRMENSRAAAKEAPIRNPLAHPDYPALVELARESAKDGD